jgi:DNA-binding beta-propeller fold protein YncE
MNSFCRRHHLGFVLGSLVVSVGCADPTANAVLIEVAPSIVSSLDGTATAQIMVVADQTPMADESVRVSVAYEDRNGVVHEVPAVTGTTNDRGAFDARLEGLTWEGTGTVTAEVMDGDAVAMAGGAPIAASATFSVLDRTPPTVTILPPTSDLHVGQGLPLIVEVHVQDEIGISEVFLEAAGELERLRSTVVASGSGDSTLAFRLDIPNNALPGPTITLYALAADLSGNLSAAEPVVLTVDPAVALATAAGLSGALVSDGTNQFLDDPRALAVSPKDGMIYVADNSGNSPCNGACIRRVDPATGTVQGGALHVGAGTMEGVAFDAAGDNLYFTDRQDRLGRMSWDSVNSVYQNAVFCNDPNAQDPRDPYHLVHDGSLGVLFADAQDQRLRQELACTGQAPADFSQQSFDEPRGVALSASGEIYVSDFNRDAVYHVDRSTGAVSQFEDQSLREPYGLDWMGASTTRFADSLMVAVSGDNMVVSTQGAGSVPAAYLRNTPIDVAVAGGTMYILTRPSNGDRGRIFAVSGF